MPKLTINDVEYNTEDFNEEQTKYYNEILYAKEQGDRLRYTAGVLDARAANLADAIIKADKPAEEEEVSDKEET